MVLGQPLRKIVKGRHVVLSNGKWKKKSNKRYIWIYTLKKPVVPGDILLVNTKKGRAYICVDRIESVSYTHLDVYKRQMWIFTAILSEEKISQSMKK